MGSPSQTLLSVSDQYMEISSCIWKRKHIRCKLQHQTHLHHLNELRCWFDMRDPHSSVSLLSPDITGFIISVCCLCLYLCRVEKLCHKSFRTHICGRICGQPPTEMAGPQKMLGGSAMGGDSFTEASYFLASNVSCNLSFLAR